MSDADEATSDPVAHPPPALRRLTPEQYKNLVEDSLDIPLEPPQLATLSSSNGLQSIAASQAAMAEVDVEVLRDVAQHVALAATRRFKEEALTAGCAGTECMERWLAIHGRSLLRRPLETEEKQRYLTLFELASAPSRNILVGFQHVVRSMLQSPQFLYRVELGQAQTASRLDPYGLASRLAFFLWNSGPDDELLDAAASGELEQASKLLEQAKRLLESPRLQRGVTTFFDEWLDLEQLKTMPKVASVYPQANPKLALAMREETLRFVSRVALQEDADLRTLFTDERVFAQGKLAELYGIQPPFGSAGENMSAPGRAGLLTQASFLALHAHASRSSPTLRGKFIREKFLCKSVPPPPPDVNTTLPDASVAPTARDRLAVHSRDPACAGCHTLMDPVGLALEQFDGIGVLRKTENGSVIDPKGELDGQAFDDARGLGKAIASKPESMECLTLNLLRYARGTLESAAEQKQIRLLHKQFSEGGYQLRSLLLAIVSSRLFREVGALQ